jgi:hypothetical protein
MYLAMPSPRGNRLPPIARDPAWPGGARVAVNINLNVEAGIGYDRDALNDEMSVGLHDRLIRAHPAAQPYGIG